MSRDEDMIRAALGEDEEPADGARFSAAVLYRLGRKRRLRRQAPRLALLAGLGVVAGLFGPALMAAFAAPGIRLDPVMLALGLALLALCAMAAPRRA